MSTTIATSAEDTLRLAFRTAGLAFTRSIKHTGWVADRYDRIDAFAKGRPWVAAYEDEWEAFTGDDRRGGFYYDTDWRHPETGEDLPTWLSNALWDYKTPLGSANINGPRLTAYIKRPGTWLVIEQENYDA